MTRRDVDYAVLAAALVSGLYATISGLVADLFGFPQFFLHRYAGYVCAGLIVLHLALNWRRITAYLRWRIRKPRRQERSTPLPREQAPPTGRRQLLVSILVAAGGFALGRLIPSWLRIVAIENTRELNMRPADDGVANNCVYFVTRYATLEGTPAVTEADLVRAALPARDAPLPHGRLPPASESLARYFFPYSSWKWLMVWKRVSRSGTLACQSSSRSARLTSGTRRSQSS